PAAATAAPAAPPARAGTGAGVRRSGLWLRSRALRSRARRVMVVAMAVVVVVMGALAGVPLGVVGGGGGGVAQAAGPQPAPWDGVNPFRCELQNAGMGTSVPHPEADPFCVEYDK